MINRIPVVYAIRHKPSGHFLPMKFVKDPRYTHTEPAQNCIPRIFNSKRSAKSFLDKWLKGKWQEFEYYSEVDKSEVDFCHYGLGVEQSSSRRREDMEIVRMSLVVLGDQ